LYDSFILKLYYRKVESLQAQQGDFKSILLIKNDSIGDYIIFRNFIQHIKVSQKYQDFKLTLLTNQKLLPIVKELDNGFLDTILIYQSPLNQSLKDKLHYYKSFTPYNFSHIIHPTYSPDAGIQELIKFIPAKYKIVLDSDLSNQTTETKQYYDRFYTKKVKLDNAYLHEYKRYRLFFENVLAMSSNSNKPSINFQYELAKQQQILICPGAQHAFRIWDLGRFAKLIELLETLDARFQFLVVTGPNEDHLFTGIQSKCKVNLKSYYITSILELAKTIKQSQLVICNDSSAAHITVACNTKSVCISNGNHYERFIPYPSDMNVNQISLFPNSLIQQLAESNTEAYYYGSKIDINEIEVQEVYQACVAQLKNTI
jgi:ADP-heptose:LPS heptosyltransferase